MKNWASRRRALFYCGLAAIFSSVMVLMGTYLRPVCSTEYLKQYEEALPWLYCGLATACVGFILSFFGKGWRRIGSAGMFTLLASFWLLLAGASL